MNANKNFYILTIWVLTLHYIVTHVISNHLHFFINLPKFPLTSKKTVSGTSVSCDGPSVPRIGSIPA